MSIEETRLVVEGFLENQAGKWLAEDAQLLDRGSSGRPGGRPEVASWFARWTRVMPGRLLVTDGQSAVELTLFSEAGRAVSAAAVFDIRGGEIVRLHFFYDPASPLETP